MRVCVAAAGSRPGETGNRVVAVFCSLSLLISGSIRFVLHCAKGESVKERKRASFSNEEVEVRADEAEHARHMHGCREITKPVSV